MRVRKSELVDITSDQLVPGDLILLSDNMVLPADCILLVLFNYSKYLRQEKCS